MKNKAYIPSSVFLAIALAMHYAGVHWSLYTIITWYDDPLHFISGLGIGLAFYWVFNEFNIFGGLHGRHVWAIVGFVLAAATAWECFEAFYNLAGYPVGSVAYFVDTAKDIINGIVGSIAALVVIKEVFEKKKNE
jgi:cellobiose-specific phosphotransferase system component IIC